MTDAAERFVSVGRILKPHGVRGEVKVEPLTDDPERFKQLDRVFCLKPNGERVPLHVEGARSAGPETLLVKFREFAAPEPANALRDCMIQVPRSESPALPAGKVYYSDVIGMTARNEETSEPIGTIQAILTAGNDLFEIRTPEGKDLLVPWVEAFVTKVDQVTREVWIRPVPGLLEP